MKAFIAAALAVCAAVLAGCQTEAPAAATSPAAKPAVSAAPVSLRAEAIFKDRCKDCHDPPAGDAPTRAQIAKRKPAELREILKTGLMQPMAEGLSDEDISLLIDFLIKPPALSTH